MRGRDRESSRRANKIVRPIGALIISVVVLMMTPILSGVVAVPFFLIGQPAAYLASRLVSNLYGPLIIVIAVAVLSIGYQILRALRTGGTEPRPLERTRVAVVVLVVAVTALLVSASLRNLYRLTLDTADLASRHDGRQAGARGGHVQR